MERSRNHRLSLAILVVVLVVGAFANWRGYRDFVFEDAFITYRYADNLARGEGFVFNPGERVLGTTTPLYTLTLALIQASPVGLDPPRASALLFCVCLSVIGLLGALTLLRQGHETAAVLFALLVVSGYGGVRDFFGLETTFYSALLLASFWAATREHLGTAGALGGLAFLTRYDGALFVAALFLTLSWKDRRPPWRLALAASVIVAPWLVFAQLYFGSVLPNTLPAKASTMGILDYAPAALGIQASEALGFLRQLFPGSAWKWLVDGLGLSLVLAAVAGAPKLLGRNGLSLCTLSFPLVLWIGYSIIGPPLGPSWYLLPASYFVLLFCFTSGSTFLHETPFAGKRFFNRALPLLSGIVLMASLLLVTRLPEMIERQEEQKTSDGFYRGRTRTYGEMGIFLRDTGLSGLNLMTSEPGYLAYISGNTVIDAAGLVTPGIFLHSSKKRGSHLTRLAEEFEPDLLVPNIGYPIRSSFPGYLPIWSGYTGRSLLMRRGLFAELHGSLRSKLEAAQQHRFVNARVLEFPFAFDFSTTRDLERWTSLGGFAQRSAPSANEAARSLGVTTAVGNNFWIGIESPPFLIDFDELAFRFAATRQTVWARLVVDGQVVLKTTGRSERLKFKDYAWPVSAWRGHIGVFEIVDKAGQSGYGALQSIESRSHANTRRFDDFEDEDWGDRWEAMFGGGPRASSELVETFGFGAGLGRRLAHSRGLSGTKSMSSKPFRIEHDTMTLLLYDFLRGAAVLELEVQGEVVRSENGKNLGFVHPVVWEVEEFLGREATLVIRDVDPAPSRFVGVDEIRFHDRGSRRGGD
jgi:hypothetical protein